MLRDLIDIDFQMHVPGSMSDDCPCGDWSILIERFARRFMLRVALGFKNTCRCDDILNLMPDKSDYLQHYSKSYSYPK